MDAHSEMTAMGSNDSFRCGIDVHSGKPQFGTLMCIKLVAFPSHGIKFIRGIGIYQPGHPVGFNTRCINYYPCLNPVCVSVTVANDQPDEIAFRFKPDHLGIGHKLDTCP